MGCFSDPAPPSKPDVPTQVIQEVPQELKDYYTFLKQIGADQYYTAKEKFGPLEDKLISEVNRFQTQGYADEQAAQAESDVSKGFANARAANDARLAGFGVDPSSGRARSARLNADLAEAGTIAGASTGARRNAQLTGYNALAGISGRGDAKIGQAIQATGLGGSLAQGAYGQQVQNAQYQQGLGMQANMADYQGRLNAQAQGNAGLAGIGQLAGTVGTLAFLSTKKAKDRKGKYSGGLDAIRKMPVEKWNYKKGLGDDADHVGVMAEDFAKATGHGDGTVINAADAHGVTMSAVKELDAKVAQLERGAKKMKPHSSDPESEANQPEA
ncbi:MAG TPA: tail fiber domain-containing protein [Burkholderiaceae bacterium]|nr:tail fiber domain-containing protein [Burkholderiaceae bacterium]